jgi:hypothetical protein
MIARMGSSSPIARLGSRWLTALCGKIPDPIPGPSTPSALREKTFDYGEMTVILWMYEKYHSLS